MSLSLYLHFLDLAWKMLLGSLRVNTGFLDYRSLSTSFKPNRSPINDYKVISYISLGFCVSSILRDLLRQKKTVERALDSLSIMRKRLKDP